MQQSAFSPFYRNHTTLGTSSQELYVWPTVTEDSRIAIRIRYALLPYLYTTFSSQPRRGVYHYVRSGWPTSTAISSLAAR